MAITDWVWVPTPTVRDPRDGHWAHRSLVLRPAPQPSPRHGMDADPAPRPGGVAGPTEAQGGAR